MTRKTMILLSMALFSLSMAQKLPFGDNSDRWWFLAVPAPQDLSIFSSISNPKPGSRPAIIREDYTYTAGIGAHKVHTRHATWHEARRICDLEGGHLAIINSIAEAKIIENHVARVALKTDWLLIGFHDLFVPGEYLTVHSEPLEKAGYSEWWPGDPNNSPGGPERCGCISKTSKLADIGCDVKKPFICELPVQ